MRTLFPPLPALAFALVSTLAMPVARTQVPATEGATRPPTPAGATASPASSPATPAKRASAAAATSVLELQPAAVRHRWAIRDGGGRRGEAVLVETNPRINAWWLLELRWDGRPDAQSYHLEVVQPGSTRVDDTSGTPDRLLVRTADGPAGCDLWSGVPRTALELARAANTAWAALCDGRLLLRNRVAGRASGLERATDFLRDHVRGGEQVIGFVRRELFADAYIERPKTGTSAGASTGGSTAAPAEGSTGASTPKPAGASASVDVPGAPAPVQLAAAAARLPVETAGLGIAVSAAPAPGQLLPGRWFAASGLPGVFVAALQPGTVSPALLQSDAGRVNRLDPVESEALAYLLAFDLAQHTVGFAVGTDHPRVGWADRVAPDQRPEGRRGPDGIDTLAPLVTNGMLAPPLLPRVAGTFTGGFKRQHGALHDGDLAHRNFGSHYGFVEQGTVLSRLQPGLATVLVLDDGSVDLRTWSADDDGLLPRVRHARQNGVPLIERRGAGEPGVPGALVNRWSAGNWSGSADASLRTLRAGACLLPSAGRRFLVYGWFSSATPSAMVRVFQAAGCEYAMLLDMNALEHTYAAVYPRQREALVVEHLVRGMSVIDRQASHGLVPRFLGMPDDRDFFYVIRSEVGR